MDSSTSLRFRDLGLQPLAPVWQQMQHFTDARGPETADEIWFVEHPSVYTLLDLRRRNMTVRALVDLLENAVIDTVAGYGIEAYGRRDARGVYVGAAKLAALGLRVRRHCAYHGIAINVEMDLEPYGRINPCGYESLQVTQLSELCDLRSTAVLGKDLRKRLTAALDG